MDGARSRMDHGDRYDVRAASKVVGGPCWRDLVQVGLGLLIGSAAMTTLLHFLV